MKHKCACSGDEEDSDKMAMVLKSLTSYAQCKKEKAHKDKLEILEVSLALCNLFCSSRGVEQSSQSQVGKETYDGQNAYKLHIACRPPEIK